MKRSPNYHAPPALAWVAATIATAFAAIGALIILGAGASALGQVIAVVVGFLLLGAGAVLALGMTLPEDAWRKAQEHWDW